MSLIEEFHRELMADVRARVAAAGQSDESSAFKESEFVSTVLDDLETAGLVESPSPCYFARLGGRNPFKVNAYALAREERELFVIVANFDAGDELSSTSGADVQRSLKLAERFLEYAFSVGPEGVEPAHEEYPMLRDIHEFQEELSKIHLILVTNTRVVQRKDRAKSDDVAGVPVTHEVWDLERIRRFRESGSSHEPVTVELQEISGGGLECVRAEAGELGYKTCVAIFPGDLLADLYEDHGSRLLELNVRSYLQAKGKINREILETLVREPQLFLAYNNGITLVADGIEFVNGGNRISRLTGIQIVNGGQTTASIHRARKEHKANLSKVFVQAKITIVPPDLFEVMVPEISRLSNTQNKVSTVDLGANSAFHVGLERVAAKTWVPGEQSMWFYERARGSFQTERTKSGSTPAKRALFDRKFPVSQRVTKEELARYVNAWNGLPHVVSRGGQKSFEKFMSSVPRHEKGWEPAPDEFKKLIAKALLFRKVQILAREVGIRAFAINIVGYTISVLCERAARRVDLRQIWDGQGLTNGLSVQMKDWLPKVADLMLESAGTRNPGEWFKSESCWTVIKDSTRTWRLSSSMTDELVSVAGDDEGAPDHDVQNSIATCLEVSPEEWVKIQVWGAESGRLAHWQSGIANTLAGYAAQGWRKKPSEKQARQAVKFLEMYRESNGAQESDS
jgi:hypothetical protein